MVGVADGTEGQARVMRWWLIHAWMGLVTCVLGVAGPFASFTECVHLTCGVVVLVCMYMCAVLQTGKALIDCLEETTEVALIVYLCSSNYPHRIGSTLQICINNKSSLECCT